MPQSTREVRPFSKPGHVLASDGAVLAVPSSWSLLPPGDAALSRRIKKDGPTWTVVELKGGKRFSRGIWAPTTRIEALRAELAQERADPAYPKKLAAGRERRAKKQAEYAIEFKHAVLTYLAFPHRYQKEAIRLSELITVHAVPVGSGTVARTERIPLNQRAEAATLAWMRHQTTDYDQMAIAREKGLRREIRKKLADSSRRLLENYRDGVTIDQKHCPLFRALHRSGDRAVV